MDPANQPADLILASIIGEFDFPRNVSLIFEEKAQILYGKSYADYNTNPDESVSMNPGNSVGSADSHKNRTPLAQSSGLLNAPQSTLAWVGHGTQVTCTRTRDAAASDLPTPSQCCPVNSGIGGAWDTGLT